MVISDIGVIVEWIKLAFGVEPVKRIGFITDMILMTV
jgi:hypothetical protein